ncbi:MAG: type II secretion system minor pseudopilin GspK [Pseudomonadota bacterium]|nr:type II secretion system minor pseudopilin GspK [Pseudomonadota bacterium]
MIVRASERGAALLTVLLLVAVMASVSATALDRIRIGTRLTANAATFGQARAWLTTAELLAATRVEDLLAANTGQTTLAGNWMGVERNIALPDGGAVRARVDDGSNCFNLNSLVERRQDGTLVARATGRSQFEALMTSVGVGAGEASQIAGLATDYIDSDNVAVSSGGEDGAHPGGLSPNRMVADASELRAVGKLDARSYGLIERWVCALPTTDLSPLNVNTLLPEQALLLTMLAPAQIDVARARAQLSARPAGGFGSVIDFWNNAAFAGLQLPSSTTSQVQVKTSFFTLRASVNAGDLQLGETALFDARKTPVRLVWRQWGEQS